MSKLNVNGHEHTVDVDPGLPPLAPAFANAIARITGKPQRRLPFKQA